MKNTKLALFRSVIALLLCVSMFVGTTFAWFTDEVTSMNNIIQSGTLDVELEWLNPLGQWQPVNDQTNVFDENALWEPGHTEVVYLRVSNKGSLALKYQLGINVVSQTLGTNVYGDSFKLSDYIEMGAVKDVTTPYETREDARGDVTTSGTLSSGYTTTGTMNAGAADQYIALVVFMPEDVDNVANYKTGTTPPTINLGITLMATQMTAENDSFGSDYDTDAAFPALPAGSAAVDISGKVDDNGLLTEHVTMTNSDGNLSAVVYAGTKVTGNQLTLSVSEMSASGTNITLQENEILRSMDVHIEGLAEDNAVPAVITVKEAMMTGLNIGNYALYHVEDGVESVMTADISLDTHNDFAYDPATGDVTLAMATFSEVAVVADTTAAWEGNFDYSWYTNAVAPLDGEAVTEYIIANADQLAAFGAIVGGMNGQTQDSFAGKTVKLIADINLGDKESENNSNIIFYPIGYWNNEGTYERKPLEERTTAVESGFYTFQGTFDGNGHTISNFYQNTWEMKGDHNWYDPIKEQYYRDGMGLFGKVYGGTVKNLTVKNFSSDGEIATTGVIAAYADGATFENIAIFNCNPRVYNIGNGGIVGCVGWYAKVADLKTTFKNITVDNSNKISALWGSYDVACGGIVGQYYPTSGQTSANKPANAGIEFVNCHVSAVMDVYNDVCANYQYYAYRYTGMLIGSVRENETIDGHVYPKMDGITASGCTVHFGDWNDYYYCELVANTTASYTHDHQMSRLEQVASVDVENMKVTDLEGNTTDIPTSGRVNYVVVKAKDANGMWIHGDGAEYATCYHFVDGAVWNHEDAGYHNGENGEKYIDENGDGVADLKEDKQLVYREFNQLFTGYGWGVTSKGITDFSGITNMDITLGDHEASVEKFKGIAAESYTTGITVTIDELFAAIENPDVAINVNNVQVTISPFGANSTAGGTYVANTTDWTQGTLTFSGTGAAKITITDYYFCTPTTIEVTITERTPVEKFDVIFNNGDFLHRVGNSGTVALDKLFEAKDGASIGTVSVSVEAVDGTGASGTYSNNAIQFSGTGVVKVTITDNDYCTPTELYLEVVDAKNATAATDATANNVVLLNDITSGFTVSGRYTVFGNGFTLNYTGNGQYLNNGLRQGVVNVTENGRLDNLRIKASIYPASYLYYDEVKSGPSTVDGDKTRYHYQLSAVAASGNATISNCYIYGGRNNVFVNTGDVTIKDTVMECGVVANVQIQSNASHTIILENVTTIQYLVDSDVAGTTSVKMLGAGIIVGPETNDNPKIVLNGEFKQYNWVTAADENAVTNSTAKSIIQAALDATAYNHTVNGTTASNLGIIYMNEYDATVDNNTGLPYVLGAVSMSVSGINISGKVYSLQGATESQIYSDSANADKSTQNGWYQPQFKYDSTLGGQYVAEGGDEHCYREGDTIHVMFPSGDTKELDLAALVNIVKYSGQDLGLVITVKDENGNDVTVTDGKITLSAIGEYTVTYTVTDTLFYDKDGETVTKSIKYSWNVTISVSLKDTALPDAYFNYDTTKQTMGYAKKSAFAGGNTQYLPFLAGLKIYDYNGQTAYLRFDGDADFNKIASATITGYTSANHVLIEVKLTDGGVINIDTTARAASGGSTYTGKLQTSGNTLYYVNDGTTSATTTTWVITNYSFVGNNGVTVNSGTVTFANCENGSVPTGSFSTTIKYTVTYDANGGNCGQTTGYATSASAAVTLPAPTRSGYIFAGWYTAASGGTRVGGAGESYTPDANITLYAQWGQPCTVSYDANGGSCDTTSAKYSGTALTLPTATRDGYWFIGWYDAAEGGNKIGDAGAAYNPGGDITLYAHWQEQVEYTVIYEANGGTCGTASATYQGTALTLPTPDDRTGYKFLGWYTAASGGTKIGDAGATYTPTANVTLYAQWTGYVVTYNANEGSCSTASQTYAGTALTLPTPTRDSYTFNGWYTAASGGTKIGGAGDSYTPTADITLYAQWTEENTSGGCVTPDTLITLANGTQKRIDEVTYADQLLVWDFFKGEYAVGPAALIVNHGYGNQDIIKLTFDDGTVVKAIGAHSFFDVDTNKWELLNTSNADKYIGHAFVQANGDSYTTAKLVDVEVYEEYTESYSLVSAYHYNFITENMFSLTNSVHSMLEGLVVGEDMTYDLDGDVKKYGKYTYADFADYITYEQYVAFNGDYLKISVEKGYITFEAILALIEEYL